MDKEDIKLQFDKYMWYIYNIKISFDLYKHIKEKSVDYSNETNQIADFLSPILDRLLISTLLDLSKILDERNSENIIKLLNRCEANIDVFCDNGENEKERVKKLEVIKKAKENISLNDEKIKILHTYRDKYIAHLDKEYFMNAKKLFDDYKTSGNEIEAMLKLIIDSLNDALSNLSHTTYAFNEGYKDSYTYILKCIRETRENRLKQWKSKSVNGEENAKNNI